MDGLLELYSVQAVTNPEWVDKFSPLPHNITIDQALGQHLCGVLLASVHYPHLSGGVHS